MSATALFRHYRTSPAAIRRWKAEAGIPTAIVKPPAPAMRPVPEDFAERAPSTTTRALARHYHTGFRVVTRWVKEAGVEPMRGTRHDARPVPDDFAERAATTCTAHLMAHYECVGDAIKRWSRLTGVVPPRGRRVYSSRAPKAAARAPKAAARAVRPAAFRTPKQAHSFDTLRRETTTDGLAADHLRKFCAVYRCAETGRADQTGAWWRYGNAVLTPAELIARAERNGFEADGWRRLAPAIDTERRRSPQMQEA